MSFCHTLTATVASTAVAWSLSAALAGPAQLQAAEDRNVLILIADDYGVDVAAGYDGSDALPSTPTLDALATQGVRFTCAWSNPVCSPSRACMLTGRHAFRTGVGTAVVAVTPPNQTLGHDEVTLPEALQEALYGACATASFGKWHLSPRAADPNRQGWQHYQGLISGAVSDYERWPKTSNGETALTTVYATKANVDDALTWLEDRGDHAPWLMWVAFNAGHTPFHLPPQEIYGNDANLSGSARDILRNPRPYYFAAIEAMDREIGRLLAGIPAEDLARTTIIFVGDNGTPGEVVPPPHDPTRAKGTLYQGGVHVPMIIAGAGVQRPGSTCEALVSVVDIFATVCQLMTFDDAALETAVDSVSMTPYLQDPDRSPLRSTVYTEHFSPFLPPGVTGRAVRDDRYKLIVFTTGRLEFYDLAMDPFETENLLRGAISTAEAAHLNALVAELAALGAQDPLDAVAP